MKRLYLAGFLLAAEAALAPGARAQTTAPASRTVTGTVVGSVDRLAIPGVNVLVKGTNQGTATNVDGRYALANVPEGATLVFSFVGYKSVERPAVADNLDVALAADASGLDEVVVTAYNIKQDKRTLVTAVQEVQGKTSSTRAKPTW